MILLTFLVSFMFAVVLIMYLLFMNWIHTIETLTQELAAKKNNEILTEVQELLNKPKHMNQLNQIFLNQGIVDFNNQNEWEKFFASTLKNHQDGLYSFTYGTEEGNYYGARVNENQEIELVLNNEATEGKSRYYSITKDFRADKFIMETDIFDVRIRPWYKLAKESNSSSFSDVYKHFVLDELTVTYSSPIVNAEGEFIGVLGSHAILSTLNDALYQYMKNENGEAYVLEAKSKQLIANSLGINNYQFSEDGSFIRKTVFELDGEVLDHWLKTGLTNDEISEGSYEFSYQNQKYYITVTEVQEEGIDWLILTTVGDSVFTKEIYQGMWKVFLLVFASVTLVSFFVWIMVGYFFKPLKELKKAAESISTGDFRTRIQVRREDEIGLLAGAFNHMAERIEHFVEDLEGRVKERTGQLETSNKELQLLQEDLQLILNSTAEGIIGIDLKGNCIFCNDSSIRLLGYTSQGDLLNQNIHQKVHCSQSEPYEDIHSCKILQAVTNGEKTHSDQEFFYKSDGSKMAVEYHSYPKVKNGIVVGGVLTFSDITSKKQVEDQIEFLSTHDSLTGVFNRSFFERKMKLNNSQDELPMSIIFVDINGLKLLNDIYGHEAGDELIRTVAKTLKNEVENKGEIARIGGDEFVVTLANMSYESVSLLSKKIKTEINKLEIYGIPCSISVGFDTVKDITDSFDKIVANAEKEMYKQKAHERKAFGQEVLSIMIQNLQMKSERQKQHAEHVSYLCEQLAVYMGLSQNEIKKCKDAGFLHDIGKISFEDSLLNKEDYSDLEWQMVKQHPMTGYRILNLFDDTMDLADAIYSHHEKWDGSGYPKGLSGDEIPLISRMIGIIERYENLIARRRGIENNHVSEVENELILKELESMGTTFFDPELLVQFIGMMKNNFERGDDYGNNIKGTN